MYAAMIICPICKQNVDDDSRYCDQCGHALLYCSKCGQVGVGRRCTSCGGMMVSADERQDACAHSSRAGFSSQIFKGVSPAASSAACTGSTMDVPCQAGGYDIPTLLLVNPSLDIRIEGINGAVIGRRQGPYQEFFENKMYVSGVHAQLLYHQNTGWSVMDRHSSNGTKLNERQMQPDISMPLKNGDILSIADVNLHVMIG